MTVRTWWLVFEWGWTESDCLQSWECFSKMLGSYRLCASSRCWYISLILSHQLTCGIATFSVPTNVPFCAVSPFAARHTYRYFGKTLPRAPTWRSQSGWPLWKWVFCFKPMQQTRLFLSSCQILCAVHREYFENTLKACCNWETFVRCARLFCSHCPKRAVVLSKKTWFAIQTEHNQVFTCGNANNFGLGKNTCVIFCSL